MIGLDHPGRDPHATMVGVEQLDRRTATLGRHERPAPPAQPATVPRLAALQSEARLAPLVVVVEVERRLMPVVAPLLHQRVQLGSLRHQFVDQLLEPAQRRPCRIRSDRQPLHRQQRRLVITRRPTTATTRISTRRTSREPGQRVVQVPPYFPGGYFPENFSDSGQVRDTSKDDRMGKLHIYKGRTNVIQVDLGQDVSEDTFVSEIRADRDSASSLIATWDVAFVTDGTDGLLTLTLDDSITSAIVASSGWTDIKRTSGGEPLPVFAEPVRVVFKDVVTA